ncbi:MAG TPA: hypothetical protein VKT49_12255 [Bryobacteraceae bacterium]|nr:hypothetical protein [Bryobacteraceae bacterium]
MSSYLLGIRLSCRGRRRPAGRAGLIAAASLFVLLVEPALCQHPGQPAAGQRLPAGIRLDGVTAYSGSDWLQILDGSNPSTPPLWLLTAGASADVGADFGQRARLSIGYHAGYSYNQRFSALRGADHAVSFEFRTDPARRTVFTASAAGATGPISDALFDPRYALRVVQQASSISEVAAGINPSSPGAVINSPIELAFSGGRRRSGMALVGVTHSHSRRLSSFAHIGAAREIHSYRGEQQVILQYPNVTVAMTDAGVTYHLSNRTSISGIVGYTRSYSRLYRADWQSAGIGIDRLIGRRSFASLQAGYARMSGAETAGFGRSSYTLAGTLGTMKGFHTLAMTARRGVSDLHGLHADSTIAFEGVWSWARPATAWSFGGSLGYERLRGAGVGTVQAWVGQATLVRRLSPHFQLAFAGMYLSNSGQEIVGLARRGCRVSLVWTPGLEHRR